MPHYLFYFSPIAEAICFLFSLTIFFQPGAERYLKYFSGFLFVNLLLDVSTAYTALNHINNVFVNNLVSLVVISFELYLIREIISGKNAKRIFLYIFLPYPVVTILNIFFWQQVVNFHTMTYSLGALLIVSGCIYYFWELFRQRTSVDLVRQPAFWICSGLLFYYSCTFGLYGLINFISNLPQNGIETLFIISIIINVCLYSSFTIAFICRLKTKRSMST
ncbi:MAG TPA: hypothetical protein VKU83_03775 [Puia sp.]|nr:hypothetical protein [Puia sp.]